MDCCNVNGLNEIFNKTRATKESRKYLRKGLDRRATMVVGCLRDQALAGASILEIGCGVGSLHMELLKQGAGSAVGVDVSQSYVEAAAGLSRTLGFQDATQYHMGFVDLEEDIPSADMVVLDRVICCYPDMEGALTAWRSWTLTSNAGTVPWPDCASPGPPAAEISILWPALLTSCIIAQV